MMPALMRFPAPSTQSCRSSNRPRAIQTRVMFRPSAYHAVRRLAPETTSPMYFNRTRPWGSVPFRACPIGNHHRLSTTVSPLTIGEPFHRAPSRNRRFYPPALKAAPSRRTPTCPRHFRGWPQSVHPPAPHLSAAAPSGSGSLTGYVRITRVIPKVHAASLQGFEPSDG